MWNNFLASDRVSQQASVNKTKKKPQRKPVAREKLLPKGDLFANFDNIIAK